MAYILGLAIFAVVVVVLVVWSKKTNERQAERMKMLSEEQLDFMREKGIAQVEGEKDLVTAVAVLTNVKESDAAKVPIDFIFWNAWTSRHEIGDDKIAKALMESENIKVGDYITLVIKTKDGIIEKIKEVKEYKEQ